MATQTSKPRSEPASELSEVPALSEPAAEDDVVVPIGAVGAGIGSAAQHRGEPSAEVAEGPAFGRFRRRLDRFRGLGGAEMAPGSDDESELRLQVMLLREENARLKSARHQPPSAGSAIERIRVVNSPTSDPETVDQAWGLLTDCLVIREGLEQVCVEVQQAIGAVQERLAALTVSFDSASETDLPQADGAGQARA